MIDAWIVVRKERHIDDKFWVCFTEEVALQIAADVTRYWQNEYKTDPGVVEETCYGDRLFYYDVEDAFRVYVQPQKIRGAGELQQGNVDEENHVRGGAGGGRGV